MMHFVPPETKYHESCMPVHCAGTQNGCTNMVPPSRSAFCRDCLGRYKVSKANFEPRQITGAWKDGYVLDVHTLSSTPIGFDEFGRKHFETSRTEIGELLYQLKYHSDPTKVDDIAAALESLVKTWNPRIDVLIPVPASSDRAIQPVALLAVAIGKRLGVPVANCVSRLRDVPQLKNVFDRDQRAALLDGLHAVNAASVQGKSVLLFDDLFRSGSTMNAITSLLYKNGASDVYALAITRTRNIQ